jgi:hypothetical protein
MILHDINTGYTYDLDLQVYLLNVYHNHEFEIMTTFEFKRFELHYAMVRYQLNQFYKYFLEEKNKCNNVPNKNIHQLLLKFQSSEIYIRENYDNISISFKKNIGFIPKITSNMQNSNKNVIFLDDL